MRPTRKRWEATALAAVWAALPRPALAVAAPTPRPLTFGLDAAVHVLLGLGVVLALIVLSAWAYRRLARVPRGVGGALRVLGGLSLGTRERVVLIQVGDEQLLLGVAPGRVEALHVLAAPIPTSAPAVGPAGAGDGFARRLAAALQQRRRP